MSFPSPDCYPIFPLLFPGTDDLLNQDRPCYCVVSGAVGIGKHSLIFYYHFRCKFPEFPPSYFTGPPPERWGPSLYDVVQSMKQFYFEGPPVVQLRGPQIGPASCDVEAFVPPYDDESERQMREWEFMNVDFPCADWSKLHDRVDVFLFCFSIADRRTIKAAKSGYRRLTLFQREHSVRILVGLKSDTRDYLDLIPQSTQLLVCLAFCARDEGIELRTRTDSDGKGELVLPNDITADILRMVLGLLVETILLHQPKCTKYFPQYSYKSPQSCLPDRNLIVSQERGWKVAKKLDCVTYVECSTVSGQGVAELFEEAIRLGLAKRKETRPVQKEKKAKMIRPCAIQ